MEKLKTAFKLVTPTSSTLLSLALTTLPSFAGGHLLIFGGPNHQVFLGCITCNQSIPEAIDNEYGKYGSPYATTSIFNKYGTFGSPYSQLSVCNPQASHPPVVVDEEGNFYGHLNVNTNRYQISIPQLQGLVVGICR
ncbi:hypothetical protein [Pantanalinema sp. GBBB05]|uniref:hypothetical protein n=1 Tax=Pantanalinema sp. GBBB05 TaxID=2604139 RepID=UPI001DA25C58|nr:hypothetical protein [Pantanalinema sp. GBBB05]